MQRLSRTRKSCIRRIVTRNGGINRAGSGHPTLARGLNRPIDPAGSFLSFGTEPASARRKWRDRLAAFLFGSEKVF